jgi:transposase
MVAKPFIIYFTIVYYREYIQYSRGHASSARHAACGCIVLYQ